MRSSLWLAALALLVPTALSAADPVVKKSDSGICHDVSSASFKNTQKFTPYASLDECLKSGGRMPVGKQTPMSDPVKKSENGICHDKGSPHYDKTKNFTPFASMDECLQSGGKPPKK